MDTYNEKEIIALLQDPKRQREAFECIVKQYSEQLYWQIRRMVLSHDDANDLLQNTFIKAWQKARKGKNPNTTDAEYEEIVDEIAHARLESDKLDIEYLNRFKKILSPKKLFKLQRAEIKFHRDLLKIMHQPNKPDAHKK